MTYVLTECLYHPLPCLLQICMLRSSCDLVRGGALGGDWLVRVEPSGMGLVPL